MEESVEVEMCEISDAFYVMEDQEWSLHEGE